MAYLTQAVSSVRRQALFAGLVVLYIGMLPPAAAKGVAGYRSRDLFPMKPGLKWVYELRTRASNHQAFISRLEILARGPMRFSPLGRDIFVFDEVVGGHPDPTGYYFDKSRLVKVLSLTYTKQKNLVWLELPGAPALPAPYAASKNLEFFLPESLGLHTTWKARFYVAGALVDTRYEVTGIEEVQVDALKDEGGSSRPAAKIESVMQLTPAFVDPSGGGSSSGSQDNSRATYRFVEWYCPGVGLIRSLATGPGKEDSSELTLVGFAEGQIEGLDHRKPRQ